MTGEFELIQRYFSDLDFGAEQVLLSVGDDCALLQRLAEPEALAVSTDTLIAGVHFPDQAPPEWIASRALRVNLSDLAAMGAKPYAFTLALSLPQVDEQWLAEFARGLRATAEEFGIPLVGGDTTRGGLSLTITVMGSVNSTQALCRHAAKADDGVYVSGSLGDGAAALHLLSTGRLTERSYLFNRFYGPEVDFKLACAAADCAHAAIDVSDGLLADLGHILAASGVGAQLCLADLPISTDAITAADGDNSVAEGWALSGGDDYRLCITMPERHGDELRRAGFDLTRIGHITADRELIVLDGQGHRVNLPNGAGYQHFASTQL